MSGVQVAFRVRETDVKGSEHCPRVPDPTPVSAFQLALRALPISLYTECLPLVVLLVLLPFGLHPGFLRMMGAHFYMLLSGWIVQSNTTRPRMET
jgi:hypothetical protein